MKTILLTALVLIGFTAATTSIVLLCYKPPCNFEFWTSLYWCIAGALLSAVLTLVLIKFFRPKIKIGIPELKSNDKGIFKIYVPLFNTSQVYDAINVQIEVALINDTKSEHLEIDKPNFLILPHKCNGDNSRVFKANISDPTVDKILRVRVYAQHQFTGFGKSFEKSFKKQNNTYYEI